MGNLCQSGSSAGSGRAGKLHQNYELLGSIGEGSTALVFAAVRKHDGRRVAVKEIDKVKFSTDEVAGLLKEAQFLKVLGPHRQVVSTVSHV
jgi:serine/threonine protein kinase